MMNSYNLTPKTFVEFVISSMRDTGDTMLETLIKEMDYFLSCKYPSKRYTAEIFHTKNGIASLETEFRKYLSNWNIPSSDENFYTDVFMGRENDFAVKNNG